MPLKNCMVAIVLLLVAAISTAAEHEVTLVIRDHLFFPATLEIPAGMKVRVMIDNQDPTPEEFDSKPLNREKVIPGKSKTVIFIGPLAPGQYEFTGEFYPKTAQGKVVVK